MKKCNLVVVAHPDDETLFFGGLIMANRRSNWRVVCATDGNADGLGRTRHDQFARACRALGVRKFEFLDLPDRYESRLSQRELQSRLAELYERIRREHVTLQEVYTHGPLGEYGHPHHQDVSLAVHETFSRVNRSAQKSIKIWGVAYNCAPDRIFKLPTAQFKKKCHILAKIYLGETSRFIQYLPVTSVETFARFNLAEVRVLHEFFAGSMKSVDARGKYSWFQPYLNTFRKAVIRRPF